MDPPKNKNLLAYREKIYSTEQKTKAQKQIIFLFRYQIGVR